MFDFSFSPSEHLHDGRSIKIGNVFFVSVHDYERLKNADDVRTVLEDIGFIELPKFDLFNMDVFKASLNA